MRNRSAFLVALSLCVSTFAFCQAKPKITLDEFFNSVYYRDVHISPDGNSVVFTTERADWDKERFRDDLWLYRLNTTTLLPLTQSGHDNNPQFSPDGQWIAFLSDRADEAGGAKDGDDDKDKSKETQHVYVISASGGEAFGVTRGEEEVHAYAWAPDSKSIYFATRTSWSKEKKDAYKKEWKDTLEYRNSERGDVIARIALADVMARHLTLKADEEKDSGEKAKEKEKHEETAETPGSVVVGSTPLRVRQLAISPDSAKLAFLTSSISEREESASEYEVFAADLNALPTTAKRLTNNSAIEFAIRWAADNKHIFFQNSEGSVDGLKYADTQNHMYWIDATSGEIQLWLKPFGGAIAEYTPLKGGNVLTAGMLGTQVQLYTAANATAEMKQISTWPGTYSEIAASATSPRVAFAYSRVNQPTELYVADSLDQLASAKPITSFNRLFTDRALPEGKPFQWKADDGITVEGMLIYPPGKMGAKNLRMLTLIHGGPIDADGDRFGADWYEWAILAASEGWLVFRPNYRGSTGYGDTFEQAIVPHLVSKPGRDILEGVDALVKAGIADPNQLAVGGYSYGGYMTNWLITQTDRFKVAVTGAGAVEHAANWGNDDTTLDDAWYLGGPPWAATKMYTDEAALFQMNKVKTPTHMVAGADDIRVAVLEDYLLEHALKTLNIPSALLVFPGEGHGLGKNPWHGKIKVREELKWLEKYLPTKNE